MANNLDIKATSQYILLITFTWAGGAVIARYCASDKPYTDSVPNTYTECPTITVDFNKQTGGVTDEIVKILMPVVDPVLTMLVGYPFSKCNVLIEEIDITDSTTRRKLFYGIISLCTGNKNGNAGLAEVQVSGLRYYLSLPLGIPALNTCAWTFGDANCTKNVAALAVSVTISTIVGTTVTLAGPITANQFNRGFITIAGLSLMIRSQTSTTVLVMINPPPPSWAGQLATITPGCRKTVADCSGLWSNLVNFGGFGIGIPTFQPTTEIQ